MATNSEASHAHIWDDSALVDSWNEALGEYQKYHSLQARKENVEQILARHEDESDQLDGITHYEGGEVDEEPVEDLRTKKEANTAADVEVTSRDGQKQHHVAGGPPALPQHLIGQVQDEGLKNLLMSWYYAGYYTGLYEGQSNAGKSAKHES